MKAANGEYICFKDVSFRYKGTPCDALGDINLAIGRGTFTAVIGPNGSGKSTLARHINGLLLPSSGSVTVEGMETGNALLIPEIRRRVGFVFQNPDNQLVGTTVEEDIAFGPENIGMEPSAIRESVQSAMSLAGIAGLGRRAPHTLSGGQKQQLAIAGAVAMKTRCIVLDEPTSMIGPAGKRSVLDLLVRLKKDLGMTVILVTHSMEEAVFADRVLVLHRGRIIMDGAPAEAFRQRGMLAGIGLEIPGPAELTFRLRERGVPLPETVLTVDELVSLLCRL